MIIPTKTIKKQIGDFIFELRPEYDGVNILENAVNNVYRIPEGVKTVIDIGAHLGGVSVFAASMGAEVYAYEPQKDNFELLLKNIALNNFIDKIHPFEFAVGDISLGRKRKLYISIESSAYHGMEINAKGFRSFEDWKHDEINVVTLGEIFISNNITNCDFLKIDCEGTELEILLSCSPELFDRIKMIVVEIDGSIGKKTALRKYLETFYTNSVQHKNEYFFYN